MAFDIFDQLNPRKKVARVYPTGEESREHIVFENRPAVYRERMSAKVAGKTIKDVFLYEPDPQDMTPVEVPPTVKFGGLFTNGNLYMGEAMSTAQTGRQFVTFITNRHLPIWTQMFDERHRNSPYLRTAQNGRAVIKATMARTGAKQVRALGHSYSGETLTLAAAHSGEYIESIIQQDPSGLGLHDVRLSDLWNHELQPAGPYFLRMPYKPPQMIQNTFRHISDNPVLAVRELVGLRHPDIKPNLDIARHEKGVKAGFLALGMSAIFNAANNLSRAEAEELFDMIRNVEDAYHIAPNLIDPSVEPGPIVLTQNQMFDELAQLDSPSQQARR